MVQKLIGLVVLTILAVFLANTYITGNTNTFKSETTRIGNNGINNVKEVEKAGTIYTP
jgi:hypothetical protein